jgi:DNA-binding CsgD family transcriptional regulator
MTKNEFQHNVIGAKTFLELSPEQYDGSSDFWMGYGRGLRRHFYGDRFGTEQEHKIWLSFADSLDISYRMRTLGYRTGFEGQNIQQAMKLFAGRQYLSDLGKIGGAVSSARKTRAVRKNAKLGGRPRVTQLTPRQEEAWNLRQSGKTLQEIAEIMETTRESIRQWLTAAHRKLKEKR